MPDAIKKLHDVHHLMLDYILANPGCTYAEISRAIGGYSIGWISQIYNSDSFQAELAQRRIEVWGELQLTIKDRITGLAHSTLNRLEEKVQVEQKTSELANVADLALKALGFGSKPSTPGQQTNIIVGSVDKSTLEAARQIMHRTPAERQVEALPEPAAQAEEHEQS